MGWQGDALAMCTSNCACMCKEGEGVCVSVWKGGMYVFMRVCEGMETDQRYFNKIIIV
jgi:hypothetical protein